MISRRGFLKGMLALGAAPAICKAENLMKIFVPPQEILIPTGFSDVKATWLSLLGADYDGDYNGDHDGDTASFQAWGHDKGNFLFTGEVGRVLTSQDNVNWTQKRLIEEIAKGNTVSINRHPVTKSDLRKIFTG